MKIKYDVNFNYADIDYLMMARCNNVAMFQLTTKSGIKFFNIADIIVDNEEEFIETNNVETVYGILNARQVYTDRVNNPNKRKTKMNTNNDNQNEVMTDAANNTENQTSRRRGAKSKDTAVAKATIDATPMRVIDGGIVYPEGEFSMDDLANVNGKKKMTMYIYAKNHNLFNNTMRVSCTRKVTAGKGKPTTFYVKC
jgi:hypothetical protein